MAALVLLAGTLTLAACGAGARDVRPRSSAVPGIAGRSCKYVSPPDATPRLTELARLGTRGNIALWGRGLGPGDSVQISVRYAGDGRLLWVEAIRSTLPPERLEPLERLLLEAMTDSIRADWGVRLWVVDGEVTEVAPSVICPPRPRRGSAMIPRVTDERTLQWLVRLSGRRFPVEVSIDERGNVVSVRLVRPPGSYAAKQYILEYVWRTSFEPKLHDGIGVPSVLETQIQFPRWR
ncbi:MAG: hypothetical protein R6U63_16105 [Longimicrobiales bacterium]